MNFALCIILAVLETFVLGTVRSASTYEPIPNANISFRGTKIGTATAADGTFYLHLSMGEVGRMRVSAIGYAPQTIEVQPGEHFAREIVLVEQTNELTDVLVYPGGNPALAMLDSLRYHRPSLAEREQVEVTTDTVLEPLTVQRHLDFYSATMPFGSISFLSPLARGGNTFYRYVLSDSIVSDTATIYHIDYRPRNTSDPLLAGRLTLDGRTWKLTKVSASVPYRANINHLRSMDYTAEYDQGILRRDSMNTQWQLSVWRDTVHTTPESIMRIARWTAYTVHTGYFSTGTWLDIGDVSDILRYSDYEGLHLGLPFRTNERLMRHVSLEGSVAYGFRDRRVKYRAGFTALLPTKRRHTFSAYVADRYEYLEDNEFSRLVIENSPFPRSFSSFVLQDMAGVDRGVMTTARRVRSFQAQWQADWLRSRGSRPALETTHTLRLFRQKSPFKGDLEGLEEIEGVSLSSVIRLGWGEQAIDIFTIRRHLYGRYPTLFLGAQLGSWRPVGQTEPGELYGRFHLTLKHIVPLGPAGALQYALSAGVVVGNVPDELADQIQTNYGWTYDSYRFSLLRQGEYASRRWVTLNLHWNGGGILFNRIPYICRARLRELAEFKAGYADCLRTPYLEAGAGIGNVLGVGEFLFVARLTRSTYDTPWMGFRFRIHAGL